jgi:hypothetical protein
MPIFDLTRAAGALTRVYDRTLHEVLMSSDKAKQNPGFVSLQGAKTETTPFGEAYVFGVQVNRGGGFSSSISVSESQAAAAVGSGPIEQFVVTPQSVYTTYTVEGKVLRRAKDEGAFIKASSFVVNNALKAHMRKLCVLSHGSGTGKIATIIASGGVNASPAWIKVAPAEVRNIEKYDYLVASQTDGGALRSQTSIRVTGRNTRTGQIDLASSPVALAWANSDSVYWEGCAQDAGTVKVPLGYFAWCPAADPSSTTFFNVDRSTDPIRLGGNRFDGQGLTRRKALINASLAASAEGALIDRARVSFNDFAAIANEGETVKTIELKAGDMNIGFDSINLAGVGMVLRDESLPDTHAMLEDSSAWKYCSTDGKLAHIMKDDGLVLRKVAGADAFSVTIVSDIQMVNERPGHSTHLFNFGVP